MIIYFIFLVTGVVSIIIGFIFIINPKLLIKASEVSNKVIFSEEHLIHYPRFLGFILFIVSIVLMYISIKY